ncbi:MAG TPA: hypothetical protein VGS27_30025 [Candidatus Sulfotelmatobacter sp.]|nr:hypothetical protein [Candidatus Sulfotelmatobacter sp.]
MATAAVSSSSIYQEMRTYFQERSSDLQKLGQALKSGDLNAAQQEYQAIQQLGQSGPFASGDPFKMSQREQAFEAVGKALQSGDLTSAQQAFQKLADSFRHAHVHSGSDDTTPSEASSSNATSSMSASGPEIILNLGNMPAGEQITIGLSSASDGSEQVTISAADQQGKNPEQITLNLAPNSNQQIVLNLFNSSTSNPAGSAVNVSA